MKQPSNFTTFLLVLIFSIIMFFIGTNMFEHYHILAKNAIIGSPDYFYYKDLMFNMRMLSLISSFVAIFATIQLIFIKFHNKLQQWYPSVF